MTAQPPARHPYPADSLRALAAKVGLRIGTAVNPDLLGTNAKYTRHDGGRVLLGHGGERDEVGEPRADPRHLQLGPADELIAFAKRNTAEVRGHVLVWHNQLPAWLTTGVADGSISNAELRDLLRKHITDVVSHYKGKIWQWDVVNEAVSDPWDTPPTLHYKGFWAQHLGPGYIADAFRWARAADPKALLFYNDYNIEAFGSGNPADDKTQFVYDMVKQLRAQRVPIDGVGVQGHLGTQYGYPDLRNNLQRFADLRPQGRTDRTGRRIGDPAGRVRRTEPVDPLAPHLQAELLVRTLLACLPPHVHLVHAMGLRRRALVDPGLFHQPAGGRGPAVRRATRPEVGVLRARGRPRAGRRRAAHMASVVRRRHPGDAGGVGHVPALGQVNIRAVAERVGDDR